MKKCPNCGTDINEAATGCPECGARWDEDGTYAGVPEGTPALQPIPQPKTVAEMTPKELGGLIFHQALWACILAIVAMWLVTLALGVLMVGGCSGGFD